MDLTRVYRGLDVGRQFPQVLEYAGQSILVLGILTASTEQVLDGLHLIAVRRQPVDDSVPGNSSDKHRLVDVVEGICNGAITTEERGGSGFGYDPVFFVPSLGCTAAELPGEDKNRYSHRGRAARVLAGGLEAIGRLP